MSDFIFTLDSEPEDTPKSTERKSKKAKEAIKPVADDELGALNPDFNFDAGGGLDDTWLEADVIKTGSKPEPISVDDIIARRKAKKATSKASGKRKRDSAESGEDNSEDSGDEEDDDESGSDDDESEGFGEGADDLEMSSEEEEDPLALSGSDGDDGDSDEDSNAPDSDAEPDADELDSSADSDEETQAERDRKTAFFADEPTKSSKSSSSSSFSTLNLSRPLVRAITALNFTTPTPIQASTIPVALAGHDVLGSAVTGSGKTAAFMIPALERLMFRERAGPSEIRVLVLVPTRELAVQCADVGKSLARFTDVQFGTIVGGLPTKAQEQILRSRPDILIATPGRLIDHLQNTPSFTLNALDILILDEADRMLSDGFAAELQEIINACPKNRQTMLFSATMTDDVDSLVRLSLNDRPVRLFVDPKKSLARGLVQEFVRVRREEEREALLLVLCARTAKHGTIVFFRSKKLCHQMRVVFGVLGLKAAELHGDLTQEQRLLSLSKFRSGAVDYLLATDLASRGLDIKGMQTVINYDMPSELALYLHRVGRTARAGEKGRSISLVGEGDRAMLKAAMKRSDEDKVRHRLVPAENLKSMRDRLEVIKGEVAEVLKEEVEEKAIRRAEMELNKGINMIEHQDEIFSRPKKTWFTSASEKEKAENISKAQYEATVSSKSKLALAKSSSDSTPAPKRDKFSGMTRKAKRRKLAAEEDKEFNDKAAVAASIRAAKKSQKPLKIGEYAPPSSKKGGKSNAKGKKSGSAFKVVGKGAAGFDRDLGARGGGGGGGGSREGMRAKKGDGGILSSKKKGKGGAGGGKKPSKGRR